MEEVHPDDNVPGQLASSGLWVRRSVCPVHQGLCHVESVLKQPCNKLCGMRSFHWFHNPHYSQVVSAWKAFQSVTFGLCHFQVLKKASVSSVAVKSKMLVAACGALNFPHWWCLVLKHSESWWTMFLWSVYLPPDVNSKNGVHKALCCKMTINLPWHLDSVGWTPSYNSYRLFQYAQ